MRIPAAVSLVVAVVCLLPAGASARNVQEWGGIVRPGTHSARGSAAVVRVSGGRRVLTLRSFALRPGPVVRVWLAGSVRGNRVGRHVDLGRLKGSRGDQSYRIPAGVRVSRYPRVVFWCVPFTQVLAKATLRRS